MAVKLFCDLNRDWSQTVRSRKTAHSLAEWSKQEPALIEFKSLDEIVERAHGPDRSRRDEVLAALLKIGMTDKLALRIVLHVLMPGLITQTNRFLPGPHSEDEVAATLVDVAWRRICNYPLDRRPRNIAGNIALDTRQIASGMLFKHKGVEIPTAELAEFRAAPAHRPDPAAQLVKLLDRAVRDNVVSLEDARLVALTRIHDVPISELAATRGIRPHSLRRHRLRVEAALARAVA